MERKNEHQGEIKDPRKITAGVGGKIKNTKEKTYKKRKLERDHRRRK